MIPVASRQGEAVFASRCAVRATLQLLVDPAPGAEFDKSWVAVHELSHLMHRIWATAAAGLRRLGDVLPNVLRGRSGLADAQAWDRCAKASPMRHSAQRRHA